MLQAVISVDLVESSPAISLYATQPYVAASLVLPANQLGDRSSKIDRAPFLRRALTLELSSWRQALGDSSESLLYVFQGKRSYAHITGMQGMYVARSTQGRLRSRVSNSLPSLCYIH